MKIESEIQSTKGKQPFVLIVDDDGDQRFLFQSFFESRGFVVATAASARDAEAVLDEVHVDLMICDVHMPDIDGKELITRVRRRRDGGQMPIFSFTADMRYQEEELVGCGATAHYHKTEISRLLRQLRMLEADTASNQTLLEKIQARF